MPHTPGPWKAKWTERGRCDGIVSAIHNHPGDNCYEVEAYDCPAMDEIVTTDSGYYGPKPDDARLIAAAPDLLAACKLALGAFERNDAIDWSELEHAIQKAEGAPGERAAGRQDE